MVEKTMFSPSKQYIRAIINLIFRDLCKVWKQNKSSQTDKEKGFGKGGEVERECIYSHGR